MQTGEEKRAIGLPHNIIMEQRRRLNISGVSQVDSFDEQAVVLQTELGALTIKGSELHIDKLSVDTGELNVTGSIYGLVYSESKTGSFFSRIFK